MLQLLLIFHNTVCTHHHFKMRVVIRHAAKLDMLNLHDWNSTACRPVFDIAGQLQLGLLQPLEWMAKLRVLTLVTQVFLLFPSVPTYTILSTSLKREICELPGIFENSFKTYSFLASKLSHGLTALFFLIFKLHWRYWPSWRWTGSSCKKKPQLITIIV